MTRYLFCEGDSITQNGYLQNPAVTGLPGYLFNYLLTGGQAFTFVTNFAVGAATIGTSADLSNPYTPNGSGGFTGANSIWGRQALIQAQYIPGYLNVLTLLIGTNGAMSSAGLASLLSYCSAMKATGFTMLVCTVLPLQDANVNTPGTISQAGTSSFNVTRKGTFNPGILAAVGNQIDAVADFASDSIIGADVAPWDLNLFPASDGTHPGAYGEPRLSNIMWRPMETLITQGSRNLRLA